MICTNLLNDILVAILCGIFQDLFLPSQSRTYSETVGLHSANLLLAWCNLRSQVHISGDIPRVSYDGSLD
ncbi:unnamed protein product [Cylindrotheca closterium]|uniref:Uncharacterized protein n=1 Tax=Cylindrotheca closterium TaxID=2856 RepID=A0AAD2JMD4_9STRA|nr:unnamed protein product [Cylindrotheca closterium]